MSDQEDVLHLLVQSQYHPLPAGLQGSGKLLQCVWAYFNELAKQRQAHLRKQKAALFEIISTKCNNEKKKKEWHLVKEESYQIFLQMTQWFHFQDSLEKPEHFLMSVTHTLISKGIMYIKV